LFPFQKSYNESFQFIPYWLLVTEGLIVSRRRR